MFWSPWERPWAVRHLKVFGLAESLRKDQKFRVRSAHHRLWRKRGIRTRTDQILCAGYQERKTSLSEMPWSRNPHSTYSERTNHRKKQTLQRSHRWHPDQKIRGAYPALSARSDPGKRPRNRNISQHTESSNPGLREPGPTSFNEEKTAN